MIAKYPTPKSLAFPLIPLQSVPFSFFPSFSQYAHAPLYSPINPLNPPRSPLNPIFALCLNLFTLFLPIVTLYRLQNALKGLKTHFETLYQA